MPPFRRKFRRGRKRPSGLTKRQAKEVKKIIHQSSEQKYELQAINQQPVVVSAPYMALLNPLAVGTAYNQRIGDKVRFNKIMLKYYLLVSTTSAFDYIRVVIFQWKPFLPTATLPTPGDIFFPGVGGVINYTSHYNDNNKQLYSILYDKMHTLVGNATPNTSGDSNLQENGVIQRNIILNIRRKTSMFQQALVDSATNLAYIIVFSSAAAPTATGFFYNAKIYFDDF